MSDLDAGGKGHHLLVLLRILKDEQTRVFYLSVLDLRIVSVDGSRQREEDS